MFGSFRSGVGAGSGVSGQYRFAGTLFPMLGPFTQPPDEFSGSVLALMGGGRLDPVNWEFVVRFGEGSQVGSSIVTSTSAIPEPSRLVLLVGGSNDGWACQGSAQIQAGVIWTPPVRLFGNGNEAREFPRSCKIVIAAGSGGG
jgi:hypothetical protein